MRTRLSVCLVLLLLVVVVEAGKGRGKGGKGGGKGGGRGGGRGGGKGGKSSKSGSGGSESSSYGGYSQPRSVYSSAVSGKGPCPAEGGNTGRLKCWTCFNARSHWECYAKGSWEICNMPDAICYLEVRDRQGSVQGVTRSCKSTNCCDLSVRALGGGECTRCPYNHVCRYCGYGDYEVENVPGDKPWSQCENHGHWLSWEPWGSCSVKCGQGRVTRRRVCSGTCGGKQEEVQTKMADCGCCPVDGKWSCWGGWSKCVPSEGGCGNGVMRRERKCKGPQCGGKECGADGSVDYQEEQCDGPCCPVDATWGPWGEYGPCEPLLDGCGPGGRTRTRVCIPEKCGGKPCPCMCGSYEVEPCDGPCCPVNGYYEDWGEWSECLPKDGECGEGERIRTRVCVEPQCGGKECKGKKREKETCNAGCCPVDGYLTQWGPWGSCKPVTGTCGSQISTRTRKCEQPLCGGAECEGELKEQKDCEEACCPVDGEWREWGSWGSCKGYTGNCGEGYRERTRMCDPPRCQGKPCDYDGSSGTEREECDAGCCPVDCKTGDWSYWSTCTVSCGIGLETRSRDCEEPQCQGRACPAKCKEQTRKCKRGDCVGDPPCDDMVDFRCANIQDEVLDENEPWLTCSEYEDPICQQKLKFKNGNSYILKSKCSEKAKCFKKSVEKGICEEGQTTGVCTQCVYGEENIDYCCAEDGKPEDTWSYWTDCSVTCGKGHKTRERSCDNPEPSPCGKDCAESDVKETKECNAGPCPDIPDPCDEDMGEALTCLTCTNTDSIDSCRDAGVLQICPPDSDDTKYICRREVVSDPATGDVISVNQGCAAVDSCMSEVDSNGGVCTETGEARECIYCDMANLDPGDDYCCSVDGSWQSWLQWSSCESKDGSGCGEGTRIRSRLCTDPVCQGEPCGPVYEEEEDCDAGCCPVDRVWGEWTGYGDCIPKSGTCGEGEQTRTRPCTDPVCDGLDCGEVDGSKGEEKKDCDICCPSDGSWTEWGEWEECVLTTTTCGPGVGTSTRYRSKVPAECGGNPATGSSTDSRDCDGPCCPVNGVWGEWTGYGECFPGSGTCGEGEKTRTRPCKEPVCDGLDCGEIDGSSAYDNQACDICCSVDGYFSDWTKWGDCMPYTDNCGAGEQSRTREKIPPMCGGIPVDGDTIEVQACTGKCCPENGKWDIWGEWDECAANNGVCGDGTRQRIRECMPPICGGEQCGTDSSLGTETEPCDGPCCPVDAVWSQWRPWGLCQPHNGNCGSGISTRRRECTPAECDGVPCNEEDGIEERDCEGPCCPEHGAWENWSEWEDCEPLFGTCGQGVSIRTRDCKEPKCNGLPCGSDGSIGEDDKDCEGPCCPVDGSWNPWLPWGDCIGDCGVGKRTRTRTCVDPVCGGNPCGFYDGSTDTDEEDCDAGCCPEDGDVSEWNQWSICFPDEGTCGEGTQYRSRTCVEPKCDGAPCPDNLDEEQACQGPCCPVDCSCGDWDDWSECSVTCGIGYVTRTRECDDAICDGRECTQSDREQRMACEKSGCVGDPPCDKMDFYCANIVGGEIDTEQPWVSCSQFTDPICEHDVYYTSDDVDKANPMIQNSRCEEKQECFDNNGEEACRDEDDGVYCTECRYGTEEQTYCCKVDGKPGSWGQWGECSTSCEDGTKQRTRQCDNPPPNACGEPCNEDDLNDEVPCDAGRCPPDYTPPCVDPMEQLVCHSCSGDTMEECREKGQWKVCEGDDNIEYVCASEVVEYSNGTQHMVTIIGCVDRGECELFQDPGVCYDNNDGTRVCTYCRHDVLEVAQDYCCSVDGVWNPWGEWSGCDPDDGTCGSGHYTRVRTCTDPVCEGKPCGHDGSTDTESLECDICCPVNGQWTEWEDQGCEPVSGTCGESIRTYTRDCMPPECNGEDCAAEADGTTDTRLETCVGLCCPVNGTVTIWAEWSECIPDNSICGDGYRTRTRSCIYPLCDGAPCTDELTESENCVGECCPVDGELLPWDDWSECTPDEGTCGPGTRERTRGCTDTECDGLPCSDEDMMEQENCDICCPINGYFGEWGEYGPCMPDNGVCGTGKWTRTRQCVDPRCKGDECDPDGYMEEDDCVGDCCPVNCECEPEWGYWSDCGITCGTAVQTRTRVCTPAQCNGVECTPEDEEEEQQCNRGPCPEITPPCEDMDNLRCWECAESSSEEECYQTGQFVDCTETNDDTDLPTCMAVVKYDDQYNLLTYERMCTRADTCISDVQANGGVCMEDDNQAIMCTLCGDLGDLGQGHCCKVDGEWATWKAWEPCGVTCGPGTRVRVRDCDQPQCGGAQCGEIDGSKGSETESCDAGCCPVNGDWGPWSEPTPCDVTCNIGIRIMTRDCNNPAPNECGDPCVGNDTATMPCDAGTCPEPEVPCTEPMSCVVCTGASTYEECITTGTLQSCETTVGPGVLSYTCVTEVTTNPDNIVINRKCELRDTCYNDVTENGVCREIGDDRRCRYCDDYRPGFDDHCCKEDGRYQPWGEWPACGSSSGCGDGTRRRTRSCMKPLCNGVPCDPSGMMETEQCQLPCCPVDCSCSKWSDWSDCDATCGTGKQTRSRNCTDAICNGRECTPADRNEMKSCELPGCLPENPCELMSDGPTHCRACDNAPDMQTCLEDGYWQDCAEILGETTEPICITKNITTGDVTAISRHCEPRDTCDDVNGLCVDEDGSNVCRECNYGVQGDGFCCEVNGGPGDWLPWSECDVTCGPGFKTSTRQCDNPPPSVCGDDCESDDLIKKESCYAGRCPEETENPCDDVAMSTLTCLTCIGAMSEQACLDDGFLVICENMVDPVCQHEVFTNPGGTQQIIVRHCAERDTCLTSRENGNNGMVCQDQLDNSTECIHCSYDNHIMDCCSVPGGYTDWSDYGPCSTPCGGGIQVRSRKCAQPTPECEGPTCTGLPTEERSCNTQCCPVLGVMTQWTEYSPCDVTCSTGYQFRTRDCDVPSPECGGNCILENGDTLENGDRETETMPCDRGECPSEPEFPCTDPDMTGALYCFTCSEAPSNQACVSAGSFQMCDMPDAICVLTEVTNSQTNEVRITRGCSTRNTCSELQDSNGGVCNPVGPQTTCVYCEYGDPGEQHCCTVDGGVSEWGDWSTCTKSCGGGYTTRTRECNNPVPSCNGRSCQYKLVQKEQCNTQCCPVDGEWSNWSTYGACDVGCGFGNKTRTRTCEKRECGGDLCDDSDTDTQKCYAGCCPVNGGYSAWSDWGECSAECGGGYQARYRECDDPAPSCYGSECENGQTDTETQECNPYPCSTILTTTEGIPINPTYQEPATTTEPPTTTAQSALPLGCTAASDCGENANCDEGDCVCNPGFRGDPKVSCKDTCTCEFLGDPLLSTFKGILEMVAGDFGFFDIGVCGLSSRVYLALQGDQLYPVKLTIRFGDLDITIWKNKTVEYQDSSSTLPDTVTLTDTPQVIPTHPDVKLSLENGYALVDITCNGEPVQVGFDPEGAKTRGVVVVPQSLADSIGQDPDSECGQCSGGITT